ncbi:MAG: HesA/MoeB/ThiF family protein [Myxococcota bacterium]
MRGPRRPRVLVIGLGGLGSPAALAIARSRPIHLTLVDDDSVDESNLHRQILFESSDVGRPKVEVAAERLKDAARREGHRISVQSIASRFLPANAAELAAESTILLEGSDNFATKFLAADTARLLDKPVVQAGSVRWYGWSLSTIPKHTACLRCVFEDIPRGVPETCASAGVVGPVVGVLGAIQAWSALRILRGDYEDAGQLIHYDGSRSRLTKRVIQRRTDCPLCLTDAPSLDRSQYI